MTATAARRRIRFNRGRVVAPGRLTTSLQLPRGLAGSGTHSVSTRWLLSRAIMLMVLGSRQERDVTNDVAYYARMLHNLFAGGNLHNTLIEYPLPVLILMVPPFVSGALNQVAFAILFVALMLAVDALFTMLLWRSQGRQRGPAVNFWLWFVPLLGPMAYFRFDLVPATLAGAALLAVATRPRLCGAFTACGAALKLWPAVMLPTFLLPRASRRQVLASFCATGLVLAVGSVVFGGYERSISPLRWQSGRGLQIESVLASPVMVRRLFHSSNWQLRISRFQAWEIYGPWTNPLQTVSTVLTVLGFAVLAWLWWRANALPAPSASVLGWLLFATAMIVTISNKTLSPQYILWLGGPLAALICRDYDDPVVRHTMRWLLVTAVLTQLEFPIFYATLTKHGGGTVVITAVLMARNLLLIYLTWVACRQTWRLTKAASLSGGAQSLSNEA
jgi:hypothetical protein